MREKTGNYKDSKMYKPQFQIHTGFAENSLFFICLSWHPMQFPIANALQSILCCYL